MEPFDEMQDHFLQEWEQKYVSLSLEYDTVFTEKETLKSKFMKLEYILFSNLNFIIFFIFR